MRRLRRSRAIGRCRSRSGSTASGPNGTRSTSMQSLVRRRISSSCLGPLRRISSHELAETVGKPVLAMIETAAGVLAAAEIAQAMRGSHRRNERSSCRPSPAARRHARADLGFAAVDRACSAGRRRRGLRRSIQPARRSRGLHARSRGGAAAGFDGKSLIHPNQIEPCHRAFAPSRRRDRAGAGAGRGVPRRRRAV